MASSPARRYAPEIAKAGAAIGKATPPVLPGLTDGTASATLKADHPLLTWKQLLDHEELHRRLQGDRKYRRAVEDELLRDRGVAPYLAGILEGKLSQPWP